MPKLNSHTRISVCSHSFTFKSCVYPGLRFATWAFSQGFYSEAPTVSKECSSGGTRTKNLDRCSLWLVVATGFHSAIFPSLGTIYSAEIECPRLPPSWKRTWQTVSWNTSLTPDVMGEVQEWDQEGELTFEDGAHDCALVRIRAAPKVIAGKFVLSL